VVRRAAGSEAERGCEAGEDGDRDHEVSILIRVGAEERAGRAPSNVSTMIIRPPQHGMRFPFQLHGSTSREGLARLDA
jgi:hypothetical protein